MCNLPNMQPSDLKEIRKPTRNSAEKTELDTVTMFTVDYRLLKNLQDVKK